MARPRPAGRLPKPTLGNRSCGATGSRMGPASPPPLRLGPCGMSCRLDSARSEWDADPTVPFQRVDGLLDLADTLARGFVTERLQTRRNVRGPCAQLLSDFADLYPPHFRKVPHEKQATCQARTKLCGRQFLGSGTVGSRRRSLPSASLHFFSLARKQGTDRTRVAGRGVDCFGVSVLRNTLSTVRACLAPS